MAGGLERPQRLQSRGSAPDSAKHIHARTSSSNEGVAHASLSRGAGDTFDEDSATVDFASVDIKGLLDCDPRPTFVVAANASFGDELEPVFSNNSLRSNLPLLKALSIENKFNSPQNSPKASTIEFKAWLKDISQLGDLEFSDPATFVFWGFLWTGFTLHKRWLVISGSKAERMGISGAISLRNESSTSVAGQRSDLQKNWTSPQNSENNVFEAASPLDTSAHQLFMSKGTPDWTRPHQESYLSPHVIFTRSIDWGSTPLGDMSTWSPEFRQVACLLMGNPHPAALFWGEELTVIYNDAYAKRVAGIKHPALMGTGFRGPFSEIWDSVSAIFAECRRTGSSVAVEDQMLPINRRGFEEETYYTWSLTPLYGGTSSLLGLYNAPFETTRQKISDRRTRTLLKLDESVALAQSVSNFWALVLKALEENEFDFPFALLYSLLDDVESASDVASMSSESSQSMKSCVLEGSLGELSLKSQNAIKNLR